MCFTEKYTKNSAHAQTVDTIPGLPSFRGWPGVEASYLTTKQAGGLGPGYCG